jgi:hypothetical protein
MKIARLCFAILATLTIASAVAAQCGPARPPKPAGTGSLEEMIVAQEKLIIDAIKKDDAAAFKALVDVEGTAIDSQGIKKVSDVIPMLFGSGIKFSEYTIEDPQVRTIDKNTAIIHYRSSATATLPDGKSMTGKSYETTLFVRRVSKWVAVFHQSSEVAQPVVATTEPK